MTELSNWSAKGTTSCTRGTRIGICERSAHTGVETPRRRAVGNTTWSACARRARENARAGHAVWASEIEQYPIADEASGERGQSERW